MAPIESEASIAALYQDIERRHGLGLWMRLQAVRANFAEDYGPKPDETEPPPPSCETVPSRGRCGQ